MIAVCTRTQLITHRINTAQAQAQKTYHQATLRTQIHTHTPSHIAHTLTAANTHRERQRPIRNTPTWNPVRLVRFVTKKHTFFYYHQHSDAVHIVVTVKPSTQSYTLLSTRAVCCEFSQFLRTTVFCTIFLFEEKTKLKLKFYYQSVVFSVSVRERKINQINQIRNVISIVVDFFKLFDRFAVSKLYFVIWETRKRGK